MSCYICLGEHTEEIHAATARVHAWFKEFVLLSVRPLEQGPIPNREEKKPEPAPAARPRRKVRKYVSADRLEDVASK